MAERDGTWGKTQLQQGIRSQPYSLARLTLHSSGLPLDDSMEVIPQQLILYLFIEILNDLFIY